MPKGKLPKGVQTIGEAATKRGRGGIFARHTRALKMSLDTDYTDRGNRAWGRRQKILLSKPSTPSEVGAAIERQTSAQWKATKDLSIPPKSSGRLGKMAKGLGKGMKVFAPISIIQGARDWKAQGGPSARELLGIKKYKRRPKVTYGGQEM